MRSHLGWICAAMIALTALHARAQEAGFPWEDLKALYRQTLERDLGLEREEQLKAAAPVVSLERAEYTLSMLKDAAEGELRLSGVLVSGEAQAVPIFDNRVVLTEVVAIEGGALVEGIPEGAVSFLPSTTGPFAVTLRFVAPLENEANAQRLTFRVPKALQNLLRLQLPPGARLLEKPGLGDETGLIRFAAASEFTLRFATADQAAQARTVELDAVTRIAVQGTRLSLQSAFLPLTPLEHPLILDLPDGAQLLGSSLGSSAFRSTGTGDLEMEIPPGYQQAFQVEVALPMPKEADSLSFTLPKIRDAAGQQSRFVVEEPDDGELSVSAEKLVSQLPVARLGTELAAFVPKASHFMSVAPGTPITLQMRRFQSLKSAALVLNSMSLYSAFDESGSVLNVLTMELPPEAGTRFTLQPVAGAEVWSLKVNGQPREVYVGSSGEWILPLPQGEAAQVSLAYLQHGPPLGLRGALAVHLPQTNVAVQQLRVVVGLPERVQLLYAEGPVAPARGSDWPLPQEFSGRPYFFAQSFHTGAAATVNISYREPVNGSLPGGQS